MGYSTTFKGVLKFTTEPTIAQLAKLKSFFGEDVRDHKEWQPCGDASYIDLVLADDFSGIQWDDGTEKTYGLVDSINLIVREMRKEWPEFGLSGSMLAQGEDIDDRWMLAIDESGQAQRRDVQIKGEKVTCPKCKHTFRFDHVE